MTDLSFNGNTAPLVVLVNGESRLEYDRSKELSERQRVYLDRMDRQMDSGIRLGTDWVEQPRPAQRASFVAAQLVDALQRDDEGLIAACCTYLANRLPELKQIKARLLTAGFSVELVFDKPYVEEITVDFVPRPPS
ncbi:MAG: hypothetical protein JSU62_11125 [Gammaproteobacteria bacterium]|nr:MAG: hypothetical protein JSU62_11125 [Gammaproteobacteria bacterium]